MTCDTCAAISRRRSISSRPRRIHPAGDLQLDERNKLVSLIQRGRAGLIVLRVGQRSACFSPSNAVAESDEFGSRIRPRHRHQRRGPVKIVRRPRGRHDLSMQVSAARSMASLGPTAPARPPPSAAVRALDADSGEGTCLGYDIRRDADKIKRQVGYIRSASACIRISRCARTSNSSAGFYGCAMPGRRCAT